MTELIRIHGRLMHSHGVGWANATIDITYHGYSQTTTEQRPSDRALIKTSIDGTWETTRWVNAEGDYRSYYTFKFPFDQPIKIYLPAGSPPEIEFSELAIASTPPSDPSYPSLIALINDQLASSGVSFPSGGQKGQVLRVVSENPRVLGWFDSSADLTKPAAQILSGHRAVYLDVDGLRYASNDDPERIGMCIGLTTGAATIGELATVKTIGLLNEPSWNLQSPGLIFLGQNGLLLQSSPGPPAIFSQQIGKAISATTLFIDIHPPIVLGV